MSSAEAVEMLKKWQKAATPLMSMVRQGGPLPISEDRVKVSAVTAGEMTLLGLDDGSSKILSLEGVEFEGVGTDVEGSGISLQLRCPGRLIVLTERRPI